MFVHKKDRGTDIYYGEEQLAKGMKELINYFKKNPNKFHELTRAYKKNSKEILNICKKATSKDIQKLREFIVKKIWLMINITIVLGHYSNEYNLKNIGKKALELRKKYDTLIYTVGWKLWEIAKQKFPKKEKYLDYLTFHEILMGKIPSVKELERRKQGYIYFNGKLYVDKTLEQFTNEKNIKLIDETANFKDNTIKGTTAMTGKVTGRVKLVFEIPQLKKVQKGDILVTSMTVPDFLPAMKKVAAFVTDEGGITCHAAIVAREMKKPCIIGTKIATKVLKDNDLVEVDADKGFVRIIN